MLTDATPPAAEGTSGAEVNGAAARIDRPAYFTEVETTVKYAMLGLFNALRGGGDRLSDYGVCLFLIDESDGGGGSPETSTRRWDHGNAEVDNRAPERADLFVRRHLDDRRAALRLARRYRRENPRDALVIFDRGPEALRRRARRGGADDGRHQLRRILTVHRVDERSMVALVGWSTGPIGLEPRGDLRQQAQALTYLAASSIRNAVEKAHLRTQALTDPLTGLGNRRQLEEDVERYSHSERRSHWPLACVVLDMNDLKGINDTLGHDAGNLAIQLIGESIQHCLRDDDVQTRSGDRGDEFICLMPGADAEQAEEIMSRLRRDLAVRSQVRFSQRFQQAIQVSVSAGVSIASSRHELHEALRRADAAMYVAKGRKGRGNGVEIVPAAQGVLAIDLAATVTSDERAVAGRAWIGPPVSASDRTR